MPRALDPNQTTEIILAADKDNPQPARFIYRALNCREWKEKHRKWATAYNLTGEAQVDEILSTAKIGLVGWEIEGIPFDHNKIEELVTPFEADEMIAIHLYGERLNAEDKKNSVLPQKFNGEISVANAQAANA
jgi:hypothetical protein